MRDSKENREKKCETLGPWRAGSLTGTTVKAKLNYALTTRWQHVVYIRDTWCLAGMCYLALRKKKRNQSVEITPVSYTPRCSCDSANRLWKELKLNDWSVLSGKALCLEPECPRDSNFAAHHQVNNIVEEQFRKYNMNWPSLAFLLSI